MMVLDSVRCYTIGSNFSVSTFTSHSSFRSSFSKKSSSIVRPRAVEPDLFFVSRTDHVVSRAATHAASLEIIARRAYCVGTMYKSMCVCVRPFVRSFVRSSGLFWETFWIEKTHDSKGFGPET